MSSIDHTEIARFSSHAEDWWNPDGALRPLHRLNPIRLEYIRDAVCKHFKHGAGGRNGLKGLSVLDIGCGGGLLCEPMARLGADVTGLDASAEAIKTAQKHAALSRLKINYVCGSVEEFASSSPASGLRPLAPSYDVITMLEILEHVADISVFVKSAAKLLKPNGVVILSTVNRTPKGFLLGIVAAEYILKWVPRGTHDWRKFLRPSELAAHLGDAGLHATDIMGVTFDLLNNHFHLRSGKVGVNYMMSAVKK